MAIKLVISARGLSADAILSALLTEFEHCPAVDFAELQPGSCPNSITFTIASRDYEAEEASTWRFLISRLEELYLREMSDARRLPGLPLQLTIIDQPHGRCLLFPNQREEIIQCINGRILA